MTQRVGPQLLQTEVTDFVFSEKISVPTNGTIPIHLNTGPRFQLMVVSHALSVGTLTLNIQVNSGSGLATMTNFGSIAVSSTAGTVNGVGAADIIPQGSVLALNIAGATGSPAGLIVTFIGRLLPAV